ncbi:MAG: tetratricopeptide repeat protein, partial [Acetobacteraceae bacterium]
LLHRAPAHPGALINLGSLLRRRGCFGAARLSYAEAVARHPRLTAGHVNLAHLLHQAGETDGARQHYEAALALDPALAEAHQGLANLLDDLGETAAAERHRERGWRGRALVKRPYRGAGPPARLLLIISAAGGNIPTTVILDDRVFAVTVLAAEFFDPALPLPPHDVVLNAIGDADRCRIALASAEQIVARSGAPQVNAPIRVIATGRLETAATLGEIPGLVVPPIALVPRSEIAGPGVEARLLARGFGFPLLLRTPGFHTGRHFLRIGTASELAGAMATLPGENQYVIKSLEARSEDGLYRKYRVMFINGHPFPLHLAVSRHWKVHYFTADMAADASFRAEEARFLTDMPRVLGRCGMGVLASIRERLGLEYAGIDFTLGAGGEVLLFEANPAMAIVLPDADPRWNYRLRAVGNTLAAVRRMLVERALSWQSPARDAGLCPAPGHWQAFGIPSLEVRGSGASGPSRSRAAPLPEQPSRFRPRRRAPG